ncbi:phage protein NinX family protein [Proteus vulgaris]|uniref:DUF2591 domain-containing protein n=1 Tax=Proteus vulgaris TaxID=585 RepID=A0A6G6SHF0_PROVU|nr:phage protein NinX family protein [Proteus vulgaris]QIF93943.1 DUF2591 domain-containing protein [Proteus vulgaris]QIF95207.1 DUF2591 domain-containing protein [Proteus vulgaris]
MNKYTELSDFEINKNVFIKLYGEESLKDKDMFNSFYRTDYCHNPEDAMPIIIENKISLRAPTITDRWKAEFVDEYGNYVGYIRALNKNPLRAAMEVFLMMKDAENEKV